MRHLVCVLLSVVAVATSSIADAAEPLHRRIDQLVAKDFDGDAAPRTSDAEFIRRIHLDLAGRIPSSSQVTAFLNDASPEKRQEVIDGLLASPDYADRMTNLFNVMLMERRGDDDDWQAFLRTCFAENRPWNQIVGSILKPDHEDEQLRGAAYFYTRRLEKVGQQTTDYAGLTRDVGRMFLGIDLQCAECHDHLFIDDYSQQEFQGLFSVYQNLSIRKEKFPAINEKTMTARVDFISVLTDEKGSTGPRVPFGREFEIPELPPVDPKAKPKRPDPNEPPTFSALKLIAENLPSAENKQFRQNIANRLWFCMMGRGLVEPLDEFHSENQASHPELLALLADEFAAHDFDIKWMIRELVLTDTWQRSTRIRPGSSPPKPKSYRLGNQRRLTAEQLFWSTLQATGNLERLTPGDDEEPAEEFSELKAGFVTAFASEPKEAAVEYTPAVKQALFLLNDSKLLDLLKPQPGNLAERIQSLPNEKVVDELYLSIFSRLPDDDERAAINEHLEENAKQRDAAVTRVAWAMLTSIEFAVNH